MASPARKFVPRGGPSAATAAMAAMSSWVSSQRHTADPLRYNPEHKGQRGEHGMGSNCSGLDGNSTILQVPVGTSLNDQETGELVHGLQQPDERVIIAKGGPADAGTAFPPARIKPRANMNSDRPVRAPLSPEPQSCWRRRLGRLPQRRQVHAHLGISPRRPRSRLPPSPRLNPTSGSHVGEERIWNLSSSPTCPASSEGAHLGRPGHAVPAPHRAHPLLVHLVDVSAPAAVPDRWKTSRSHQNCQLHQQRDQQGSDPSRTTPASVPSQHPLVDKPMIVCATRSTAANPDISKSWRRTIKRAKAGVHAISAVTGQGN